MRTGKCFVSFLLIFFMSISLMSCSVKESSFPSIPNSPSGTEIPIDTYEEVEVTDNVYKLSCALPYSDTTIDYLIRLYYAKNTDIFPSGCNGSNVDLLFLDSVSIPIAVNNILVPDTGISYDTIQSMGTDLPDLYMTSDLKKCIDNNKCSSLNEYLSESTIISSSNISHRTLEICSNDGIVYGIPYYCTIPLIYINNDYVPDDTSISFKSSFHDLNELISIVDNNKDEDDDAITFVNAYKLALYCSSAFDTTNTGVYSYLLNEEYLSNREFAQNLFDNTCDYIWNKYQDGVFADSNEGDSDPVFTRNAAIWLDSSSEYRKFTSYYPDKLSFMQMPTSMYLNDSVPYLTVYPICVNESSSCKSLASDFALFISMDEDAQLLINRLERKSGFLPSLNSSILWDYLSTNDSFGYYYSVYEDVMDNSNYSFDVINTDLNNDIENTLFDYFNSDGEPESIDLGAFYE